MLKNLHPTTDNSRYPDEMQPLLSHLQHQGIST